MILDLLSKSSLCFLKIVTQEIAQLLVFFALLIYKIRPSFIHLRGFIGWCFKSCLTNIFLVFSPNTLSGIRKKFLIGNRVVRLKIWIFRLVDSRGSQMILLHLENRIVYQLLRLVCSLLHHQCLWKKLMNVSRRKISWTPVHDIFQLFEQRFIHVE